MTPVRRSALLVFAGSVLIAVCWMPTGLAFLLPLVPFLILRGAQGIETTSHALLFAVVATIGCHGTGGHFLLVLVRYSPLAVGLFFMALFYYALLWIALFWGALTLERRFGLSRRIGLVLLWPLMEVIRTLGDASFPADLLAYGFGSNPAWLAWMPWIGPFGMALLVWILGAFLDEAWIRRRDRRRSALVLLAIAVLVWVAIPVTDLFDRTEADPSSPGDVRLGLVQPFIQVQQKLDPRQWPVSWQRLERLTLEAARGSDLVIWPETARPGPLVWRSGEGLSDPEMEELAEEAGVPILYGCEIVKVQGRRVLGLYNGAALALPSGMSGQWYGKQRLLPFVEGVPFAELIGWDPSSRQGDRGDDSPLTLMGNFERGPQPTIFEIGKARIGVLVCYEGMYPSLGRAYANKGANLLAVVTNDAWWGQSVFPAWHARMVASFARSLDTPVVRAANSGVSSVTDASGRMRASTELSTVTTLRVEVTLGDGEPTLYARFGHLIPIAILVALVALTAVSAARRRTRS